MIIVLVSVDMLEVQHRPVNHPSFYAQAGDRYRPLAGRRSEGQRGRGLRLPPGEKAHPLGMEI